MTRKKKILRKKFLLFLILLLLIFDFNQFYHKEIYYNNELENKNKIIIMVFAGRKKYNKFLYIKITISIIFLDISLLIKFSIYLY